MTSAPAWIANRPPRWRAVPFRYLYRRTKRVGYENETLLSVYRDHGVVDKSSRSDNFNNASEDLGLYQLVDVGDLAINKMKAWQGSVAVSPIRGIVSPAYFVYAPTHHEHSGFLHYLFRSAEYVRLYQLYSKGIRVNQWDLDPSVHGSMPVLLPPVEEQRRIAEFLDRETAQIDELIAKQEQLISTLAERRQAAIDLAIERGSSGAASGPLKFFGSIRYGLGEPPSYAEEGTALIRATNVVGDGTISDRGMVFVDPDDIPPSRIVWLRSGDIVVVRSGANTGDVALVTDKYAGSIAGFDMVFRPDAKLVPEYALACLLSSPVRRAQIDLMRMRAAQPHLSAPELGGVKVSVPDVSCQKMIVTELAPKLSLLAELASDARKSIDLLRERRQALISAAVTGRIDVGGAS